MTYVKANGKGDFMKLKNLNYVAIAICRRERSDKREVNITDVKRVMRHLSELIYDDNSIMTMLLKNGKRRKKQKRAK